MIKVSNMKEWSELSEKDKIQLLRFPAYISLLASTAEGGIDKKEKNAAIKLTHIKTFASDPILFDFYKTAEHNFEKELTNLDHELPHTKEERKEAIEQELYKLEDVLKQLDPVYASVLRHSMKSYKNYVSKAHHNILEYFIFPLPIDGISD